MKKCEKIFKYSPIGLETVWNVRETLDWTLQSVFIPFSVITTAYKSERWKNAKIQWKKHKRLGNSPCALKTHRLGSPICLSNVLKPEEQRYILKRAKKRSNRVIHSKMAYWADFTWDIAKFWEKEGQTYQRDPKEHMLCQRYQGKQWEKPGYEIYNKGQYWLNWQQQGHKMGTYRMVQSREMCLPSLEAREQQQSEQQSEEHHGLVRRFKVFQIRQ